MADYLRFGIDAADLLKALHQYGDQAEAAIKAAAKITAENIAAEARRRVARRTGHTAGLIRVEEVPNGYIVTAHDPSTRKVVDVYLEHGTKKAKKALTGGMRARPFLHNSASLEEGAHMRRVVQALDDAADTVGLGD